MSKPIQREPLKIVEIELESEDEEVAHEAAQTESRAIIRYDAQGKYDVARSSREPDGERRGLPISL